jgi:putative thioredoxin
MPTILTIADDDFEEVLLESADRFVVEIWAPACGPCRAQKKVTERLAREISVSWRFARVDAQSNPLFVKHFELRAVPILLIVVNGEVKDKLMGPHNYEEVCERLEKLPATNTRRLAS